MIFDQICRFLLIRPQNSQATLLPLRPFNQTTGFLFVGSLDSSIQVSISDNCCFGWITPRHLINFPNPKRDQRKKTKTIQNRTMGSCSSVFLRFFWFIWGLSQPWNWLKHKWATKRTIAWFWKQRWNYGERPMERWRPEWELDQLMKSNKHSMTPHFYSRWSSSVFELWLYTLY